MAIYYTTEDTIDSTGGASLSGQTATFEISPLDPATGCLLYTSEAADE